MDRSKGSVKSAHAEWERVYGNREGIKAREAAVHAKSRRIMLGRSRGSGRDWSVARKDDGQGKEKAVTQKGARGGKFRRTGEEDPN